MKEPNFWYSTVLPVTSVKKFLLQILSHLFLCGAFLKKTLTFTHCVSKPVICIGNLTVGGAGKTPTTLSIAQYFQGQGKAVAIISRGYKGRLKGPVCVDLEHHNAIDVGDEPLLMAQQFTTWVSANRYKGAKAAIKKGAEIILLDDGLQNYTLKQDLKICVLNTKQKFGNQKVMPLGPLREELNKGLDRVDAFIVVKNFSSAQFSLATKKPLIRADVVINKEDWALLKDKKLLAFAGLAHPEKFFDTLRSENFDVKKTIPFPDHHFYTRKDIDRLLKEAKKQGLHLVTTQKDWVRLPEDFQEKTFQLRIKLEYQDPHQLRRLLEPFLQERKNK